MSSGIVRHEYRPDIPVPRTGAVDEALQHAHEVLDGASPDLVVVNDPQRGTMSAVVLEAARDGWVPPTARILVATGSHRFPPDVREAFEASLRRFGFAAIGWHDAGAADLADVGGWRAHPWLASARSVLAVGSVEPHYFAGYTGAHKTLTIGCAALADIERNHAGAMDPRCRPGHPETSPVHRGVMAMLRALEERRRLAAVNLFQVGSRILNAAGGTPEAALVALAGPVGSAYLRPLDRTADVVIARVTGPLACSAYQADKGIKNNEAAVRAGGALVLDAACPQGIGQDAFCRLLERAPDHRAALAAVETGGYRLGDHKAVRLRYLTDPACRNVRLFVVSPGLATDDVRILGGTKVGTVEEALQAAVGAGTSALVCDVADAGNTCLEVVADH